MSIITANLDSKKLKLLEIIMKKIKCLLLISLIAAISICVFVGCQDEFVVDREALPYKITYCANGGTLDGKTERYFFVEENVRAIEPSASSSNNILMMPSREGYKLIGWIKGKVDENGEPVLIEKQEYSVDGGVWMNFEGAITEAEAVDSATGEYKDDTVSHKFYQHDDFSNESIWWDFSKDYVNENLALIAVWEPYNKYIFANRDFSSDSGWEDLSDLTAADFEFGGEVHEKYRSRLHDISSEDFSITDSDINGSFKIDRAGYTPIRYYSDASCQNEITFPYIANSEDKVTVIYYKDIKGQYTVINEKGNPADNFMNAVLKNEDIYVDVNIDMNGKTNSLTAAKYTGTILGNFHVIDNLTSQVSQSYVGTRTENTYGGLFDELDGANISNLTINCSLVFYIAVDPADPRNGKPLDAMCEVGAFCKSMKNTTLKNVDFTIHYIVDRSEVAIGAVLNQDTGLLEDVNGPNDYKVEVKVSEWTAKEKGKEECSIIECDYEVREMTDEEKGSFYENIHKDSTN